MTYFGDIMVATKPPRTKAEQIIKMQQLIQIGDVICRTYSYYLDTYFIPGQYTHSGIVISPDLMVHSVSDGVKFIHPIDFIKDTDGFIILRPMYPDSNLIQKAIDKAKFHVNNESEYDFLFNDPDKFYCHELVCDCLLEASISVRPSDITIGIWPLKIKKSIYLAQDIISNSKAIYEYI